MTPPLVGRDSELARLREPLADARAGGGATLLVTGGPGLGKSVLLDAAAESAADFDVLRTTGIEAESELAFASLHQLLRPLLSRAVELPARQRAALASALALDASVPRARSPPRPPWSRCSASASERRPLLLVVDDAQWVDSSSLDALVFAARRLTEDRVALIAAARSPDVPAALRAARVPELRLEPLEPAAARALAAQHAPRPLGQAALRPDRRAGPRRAARPRRAGRARGHRSQPQVAGDVVERLFGERIERLSGAAATPRWSRRSRTRTRRRRSCSRPPVSARPTAAWEEAERASVLRLQRRADRVRASAAARRRPRPRLGGVDAGRPRGARGRAPRRAAPRGLAPGGRGRRAGRGDRRGARTHRGRAAPAGGARRRRASARARRAAQPGRVRARAPAHPRRRERAPRRARRLGGRARRRGARPRGRPGAAVARRTAARARRGVARLGDRRRSGATCASPSSGERSRSSVRSRWATPPPWPWSRATPRPRSTPPCAHGGCRPRGSPRPRSRPSGSRWAACSRCAATASVRGRCSTRRCGGTNAGRSAPASSTRPRR